MPDLSHFDETGASRMVDVSGKADTIRVAVATGLVRMRPETLQLILDQKLAKGNVLEVARLAGIMGAKQTSQLIPLCHPLPISGMKLDLVAEGDDAIRITAEVKVTGKTGVEMEALTAVSIAALTRIISSTNQALSIIASPHSPSALDDDDDLSCIPPTLSQNAEADPSDRVVFLSSATPDSR